MDKKNHKPEDPFERSKRTFESKGFIGFKNQDPDFIKMILNGETYVLDMVAWRAQEEWMNRRYHETGL